VTTFEIVVVALGGIAVAAAACWIAVLVAHRVVRHHPPTGPPGATRSERRGRSSHAP
jgi:hypothetical protein